MKAVIIERPGGPEVLKLVERATPCLKPAEVLIAVQAAGVNRPDIAQRKGHYPPPPGAPQDIPGLEVAGIISACGEAVRGLKIGDAVCALIAGGGYADYAVAPEGSCLPLPKGWSVIEAASLPETVFTVWHNVFQRGHLTSGENFLVHGGSSGIGVTAIQLARAFGARVFATAGTKEKCEVCLSLGAKECVNYRSEDYEAAFYRHGMDVILDMVAGEYIQKNIRLLKEDGRLVFINTMKGSQWTIDAREVMSKRLTITGSTLRNRDIGFKADLAASIRLHVWPLLEEGKFKSVIFKTFPLSQASDAHQLMESSSHIGKIILTTDNLAKAH